MLTGRRHLMHRLRQSGGLSGFLSRKESIYDCFGAGHSSTSISAIQGIYVANRMQRRHEGLHVAVIGDGGLTGGMAYEALNACGFLQSPILVILNDNQQVSLPTGTNSAGGTAPASAVSRHMRRLLQRRSLRCLSPQQKLQQLLQQLLQQQQQPQQQQQQQDVPAVHAPAQGEEGGASFFEGLGFDYLGPLDGHDVLGLVSVLQVIKRGGLRRPTVLHLKTEKGFGYAPALAAPDRMHGVEAAPHLGLHAASSSSSSSSSRSSSSSSSSSSSGSSGGPSAAAAAASGGFAAVAATGQQPLLLPLPPQQQQARPAAAAAAAAAAAGLRRSKLPSLTSVFSKGLLELAKKDKSVLGITAAMPGGTGLSVLGVHTPQQLYDVGIAEQHAVTFAAGLAAAPAAAAAAAAKPFCCIYSTFLQRAYDQVVHDVALQNLPVRLIVDRAGLVGADGSTHQGAFDLSLLGHLPNFTVMAPSDELELLRMLKVGQRIC
ncbi:Deoxyxylulose 5-phosphate synthase (Fragment) [Eimeria tenella]|uniref:Deoxyxylulose 5-phosphate synthase n=2 Tax=Eimeria tenella TaxID=5802 RepID=U6LCI5_EIMTE